MRETQGPATPPLGGERHVKYSTTNPFYLSTGIVAGKSLGNSERLCRSLWLIQPPRKGWPASIIGIITRQAAQVELRKVDPLRDRRRSRHFEQCFQCRATFVDSFSPTDPWSPRISLTSDCVCHSCCRSRRARTAQSC